jgi:hypothetical protein
MDVCQRGGAARGRRTELRYDLVAIHDEHDFSGRGEFDVLAEAVLEDLDADGAHPLK